MFETATKDVTLERGYIDPDGGVHRVVTLRVPMIEDEIRADATIAELRSSASEADRRVASSDALHTLAMVKECIIGWEGIALVQLNHLRQLTRRDAAKLIAAFFALEAADAKTGKDLLDNGPTEGKSETE